MIAKQILDEVFDRAFVEGQFMRQLDKLDAQGMIDRRKMILIMIKSLEAVDSLEARIKSLEDVISSSRDTGRKSGKSL